MERFGRSPAVARHAGCVSASRRLDPFRFVPGGQARGRSPYGFVRKSTFSGASRCVDWYRTDTIS